MCARSTIDGELPPSAQGKLGLKTGAPAVAANVLEAGARLLSVLEEQGYAFAKVDPPVAFEDADPAAARRHVPRGDGRARQHRGDPLRGPEARAREIAPPQAHCAHGPAIQLERRRACARRSSELGVVCRHQRPARAPKSTAPAACPSPSRCANARATRVGVNAAYSTDLGGSGGVHLERS